MRLVQLVRGQERRLARVEENELVCLGDLGSVYEAAMLCLRERTSLLERLRSAPAGESLPYDAVYEGSSEWRLLPPVDVPGAPTRCLVSGTGLTHLGSARDRQAMHAVPTEDLTDSMRMFQSGVESGKPGAGKVGSAPEWFYKGNGSVLRAHREALDVPFHAEDGGEEAEVAAIYVVDDKGQPHRVGFAAGNEFSDHVFEKRNYLNLAGSKLRSCSLGPELAVDFNFGLVPGTVRIERDGETVWSAAIETGEEAMAHSLENLEHHHFKFEGHRSPGDLHVHFLGAAALSFGAGVTLQDGDWMEVSFQGMGRPLRNPVQVVRREPERLVAVRTMAR